MLKYNYGFKDYTVQIWDSAGLEKYRSITKSYFHSASGIILVVDVTDSNALSKLDNWIQNIGEGLYNDAHSNLILALTKTDQEKQMDMEFLKNIVDRYELIYFEVSSKTGENVNEMFEFLIHESLVAKNRVFLSQQTEMMKSSNGCMTPTGESRVNSGDSVSLSNNSFYKTNLPSNSKKCTC